MTVEVRPFGVRCNIQCRYCYQNPQREAGNISKSYDLEKIKVAIEAEGGDFTLFGGEPLMMPLADLEALWSWGFQKFGRNGIQTNGVLIREKHIDIFKKYNVQVGISVDGPDELNSVRWAGSDSGTRNATKKTHSAIAKLCRRGLAPSLIITLHRFNAVGGALEEMSAWFKRLDQLGISSVRLHALEVDDESLRSELALTDVELLSAFRHFAELESNLSVIKFDVFTDMKKLLSAKDNGTTCVWNACDPYTTRAVRGIEGNGQRSNCGRTNKDGIDYVKSDHAGYERYIALYQTPQEFGGCQGCRFFLVCKGQCPGTAIDGDWRNRTEHCEVWKQLYAELERAMLESGDQPLSVRPDRALIEEAALRCWATGQNTMLETIVDLVDRRESTQIN